MITSALHLNLISALVNEYGITAHSDTYAVDYGRVMGLVPTAEEALADAVDAYRATLGSAKWNDRKHRANVRASMVAVAAYAKVAGMTRQEAAAKVQTIARMFRNR